MDFTISLPDPFSFSLARATRPIIVSRSSRHLVVSNTSPDVLLAVCNLPSRINEHDVTIGYRRVFVSGCDTGYDRLAGETPRLVKTR